MGKGSGRASEAGLVSAAAFPPTSKAPNLEFLAAPATLGTSLCSAGLRPAHQDGKEWLGRRKTSPWVSVLGATLSTLTMKPLGHALLLLPSCSPKHSDTNAATPKQLETGSGYDPQISWLCSSYPGLGRGWLRREKGTCRWHASLTFILGPQTLCLLTDPKFFPLTFHPTPPPHPRPRLSYIQEGKIL